MKNIYDWDPVRIPVKLVGGGREFFYGGVVPLKEGAIADLLVDRGAITDKKFLAALQRKSTHKIMDVGSQLLVALTVKPHVQLSEDLRGALIVPNSPDYLMDDSYYHVARSPETRLVKITIGGPTAQQRRQDPNNQGGVSLHLKGLEPAAVSTSQIILPKGLSQSPADSLNHAFTLLSQAYEPWRKSHTGNVYQRVLYKEINQKWCPLNGLRNAAIAATEHQFIRQRWAEICTAMNIRFTQTK